MLRRFTQEQLPETQAPSVRSLLREPPLWFSAGMRDAEALATALRTLELRFLDHLARAAASDTKASLPLEELRALLQRELERFHLREAAVEGARPAPSVPRQDPM